MLFGELRARLRRGFEARRQVWLKKRHPPSARAVLRPNRIYILPTAACLGWVLLLLILILLAINYENNLVYGLTFLLVSVLIIAMVHTHANLRELEVQGIAAPSTFAGEATRFELRVASGSREHRSLLLQYEPGEPRRLSLAPREVAELELSGAVASRGWYHPGYLKIETRFPLGLFRAWSWIDLDQRALVYPAPIKGGQLQTHSGEGDASGEKTGGQDEFAGFSNYQPGVPVRQLAWKQYARGQGLHIKQFTDTVSEGTWLSWSNWPELGVEARLSRLCYWALNLDRKKLPFGLDLPGTRYEPATGEAHLRRVLVALALFGQESQK